MSNLFFDPSCPSGGSFYACGGSGSGFVGCCNSEPCVNGCPAGNLEPTSFNPAFYGKFPDQECEHGSLWYTCADTSPPFMGCCEANPCSNNGCPVGNLTAAFLSSDPAIADPFLGISTTVSSSSATSSATSMSTSLPVATTTLHSAATSGLLTSQTADPAALAASPSQNVPVGAIAGGAVGGIVIIALIIALLLCYRRRRTSRDHMGESKISDFTAPATSAVETFPKGSKPSPYQDSSKSTPLPVYQPHSPFPPDSNLHSSSPGQSPYISQEPNPSNLHPYPSGLNINYTGSVNPSQSPPPPFSRPMSTAVQSELSADEDTARSHFELEGSNTVNGVTGIRHPQRGGRGRGSGQEWGYEAFLPPGSGS